MPWTGLPITAVVSAGPTVDLRCGQALFADELLPVDSAFVCFDLAALGERQTLGLSGARINPSLCAPLTGVSQRMARTGHRRQRLDAVIGSI